MYFLLFNPTYTSSRVKLSFIVSLVCISLGWKSSTYPMLRIELSIHYTTLASLSDRSS
jgi:hypothetical protein